MSEQPAIYSTASLVGRQVQNGQGETLGRLEELMIDVESGAIAYAVLSFTVLPGLEDKFFAIPWSALSVKDNSTKIIVDIRKEYLKSEPDLEPNEGSSRSELPWLRQRYERFGYSFEG